MTNNRKITGYGNREKLRAATVSVLFSLSALSLKAQVPPASDSVATDLTSVSDNKQIEVWSNGNKISVDFTGMSQPEASMDVYRITGQLIAEEEITIGSIYKKEIDNITGYVIVKITDNHGWTARKLFISNN